MLLVGDADDEDAPQPTRETKTSTFKLGSFVHNIISNICALQSIG